jgi:predicted nucleic acid-binding protein
MTKIKDILIDADVVSHFISGGRVLLLNQIFPNKILILDKVYDELLKLTSKSTEVQNLINFKIVERVQFPTSNSEIYKEYLHIKKMMFKGDGESACLAYVRYTNDIIGSSNLKDVKHYCGLHSIELLTTMDFLCEAKKKNLLTNSECDDFISKVLKAGSKLPVTKMEYYDCI